MSQANLTVFEADLSASLVNLQRILNFLSLRNLASNELFLYQLYFSILNFNLFATSIKSSNNFPLNTYSLLSKGFKNSNL